MVENPAKKSAKDPDSMAKRWFRVIGTLGLILSVVVFILYAVGMIPTELTPGASAALWTLPADEYREATDLDSFAGWMFSSADGYAVSTAALAILASTALPILGVLAVSWFRRKDVLYGIMSLVIAAILILAIVR